MNATFQLRRRRRTQAGFTLVELMIAMVLGLLIVSGIVSLLVSGRKNFREDEQVSRLQDELAFAMTQITADIEMAGYWGVLLDPSGITLAATLPTGGDCGPPVPDPGGTLSDIQETWRFGNLNSIDYEDGQVRGSADPKFDCIEDARDGTDILAIRKLDAATAVSIPDGGTDSRGGMAPRVFLKSNGNVAALFKQPAGGATTSPTATEFSPSPPFSYSAYAPAIYYIRTFSTDGDSIPSLCRKRMDTKDDVEFESECIARGIEDLQLEFGVDTNADGVPNFFAETLPANLSTVVAVRVTLLARSEKSEGTYSNLKTYQLTPTRAVTPADKFFRRSLTTTVALRNPANLRKLK